MAGIFAVLSLIILPFFLLVLLRVSLFVFGRYLTAQSRDRNELLRALFKRDLDLGSQEDVTEVDNGWGKVDAPQRETERDQWEGMVGFFHPFPLLFAEDMD